MILVEFFKLSKKTQVVLNLHGLCQMMQRSSSMHGCMMYI